MVVGLWGCLPQAVYACEMKFYCFHKRSSVGSSEFCQLAFEDQQPASGSYGDNLQVLTSAATSACRVLRVVVTNTTICSYIYIYIYSRYALPKKYRRTWLRAFSRLPANSRRRSLPENFMPEERLRFPVELFFAGSASCWMLFGWNFLCLTIGS